MACPAGRIAGRECPARRGAPDDGTTGVALGVVCAGPLRAGFPGQPELRVQRRVRHHTRRRRRDRRPGLPRPRTAPARGNPQAHRQAGDARDPHALSRGPHLWRAGAEGGGREDPGPPGGARIPQLGHRAPSPGGIAHRACALDRQGHAPRAGRRVAGRRARAGGGRHPLPDQAGGAFAHAGGPRDLPAAGESAFRGRPRVPQPRARSSGRPTAASGSRRWIRCSRSTPR